MQKKAAENGKKGNCFYKVGNSVANRLKVGKKTDKIEYGNLFSPPFLGGARVAGAFPGGKVR